MSKKERILNIIKDFREFKFCGPSDDPDAQTAVCVGYNYLLVQLKRTATPFIPESIGKSLNQIEVEMNNLFSVYEAKAEIDALLPDIEQIIQGLDESVFDQAKVGWDRVKSVAEQQEQKAHTSEVTEQQLKDVQEHKTTLLLLSRRLRHLLRILRWFRHFKGPETNKAEDALRQITDFLDKVRLTEETTTALSHSLVAETLVILIKWRHQALETKRAIEWDIKQEPPYDCNSIAVDRIQNVFSELCCYMNTISHYAAILEADDILYRSMPRERTTKPWDAKQQKFREEHNDFLRRIAMDVFGLVSTPDKRAYFHKQVEAFSHKVEEHQKELEKIKKDYEANSKLQEAAKKLDEQIENAPVIEAIGCSDLEMDLNMTNGWGMLESFKDYVYYAGGFWGPQTQKVNLVHYLVHFPNSHPGDFEKIPNEAEKLTCSYTLLSAIHDKYIKEKPIFFDGSDSLYYNQNPQHWVVKIIQRYDCFNAISGGYFDSVKDTQAWIKRVLEEIKADIARIEHPTLKDLSKQLFDLDQLIFVDSKGHDPEHDSYDFNQAIEMIGIVKELAATLSKRYDSPHIKETLAVLTKLHRDIKHVPDNLDFIASPPGPNNIHSEAEAATFIEKVEGDVRATKDFLDNLLPELRKKYHNTLEDLAAKLEVEGELKSNKKELDELQSLPGTISQLLEILKRYDDCDIYVENGNNEVIEGEEAADKNINKASACIAKALELAAKLPNKELAQKAAIILKSAREKITNAMTLFSIKMAKGIEDRTYCTKTAFKNTYLSLNNSLAPLEGEIRNFLISYYLGNGSNINSTDTGQSRERKTKAEADLPEKPAEIEKKNKTGKVAKAVKRGRPKKYTDEQRKKMRDMYNRIYQETNDSKGALNKVADFYGVVSGDAVKAAFRNLKN